MLTSDATSNVATAKAGGHHGGVVVVNARRARL